jgi:hypothetical protein
MNIRHSLEIENRQGTANESAGSARFRQVPLNSEDLNSLSASLPVIIPRQLGHSLTGKRMNASHQTVGQLARALETDAWRIRRVVDELAPDLPRAGQYRLIPDSLVPEIEARLEERGWRQSATASASA